MPCRFRFIVVKSYIVVTLCTSLKRKKDIQDFNV